jgi:hypothetical protein
MQSPVFRIVQVQVSLADCYHFYGEQGQQPSRLPVPLRRPLTIRILKLAWLDKNQGSRVHDRPKKEDYFHEVRRFVQIKAY